MIGQRIKHGRDKKVGVIRATRVDNGVLVEWLVEWFDNSTFHFSWIPADEKELWL